MPAAGSGRRFGASIPKQYARIGGRSVIEWSLAPFLADARCAGVRVAIAPDDAQWAALNLVDPSGRLVAVAGGEDRWQSVQRGIEALPPEALDDAVLVHDAARPCLSRAAIDRLLDALPGSPDGAVLAVPLSDTLKRAADEPSRVEATVDRRGLWRAQTPQAARGAVLAAALARCASAGVAPTDEAQALEHAGLAPRLVEGEATNIKITTAGDLALAAAILAKESGMSMRVGSGYDVHAFGPGDHVMLGGVRIPHDRGVVAHSDGDVLLHALCDALLGAAGKGDIGQWFPDTDPRWRGADSSRFVTHVMEQLAADGWRVANVDLTLLAQAPRVAKHREAIVARVASLLGLPAGAVNLKATTTEGLGAIGRAEGLAAQASVLLHAAG